MRNFRTAYALLILLLVALLSACSAVQPAAPAAEGEAAGEGDDTITLTVWDYYARGVESDVMEKTNSEFEASHPGVKINRVVKSWDEMKATVKLALSSEDGPDVAMINQGRPDMGPWSKQIS